MVCDAEVRFSGFWGDDGESSLHAGDVCYFLHVEMLTPPTLCGGISEDCDSMTRLLKWVVASVCCGGSLMWTLPRSPCGSQKGPVSPPAAAASRPAVSLHVHLPTEED